MMTLLLASPLTLFGLPGGVSASTTIPNPQNDSVVGAFQTPETKIFEPSFPGLTRGNYTTSLQLLLKHSFGGMVDVLCLFQLILMTAVCIIQIWMASTSKLKPKLSTTVMSWSKCLVLSLFLVNPASGTLIFEQQASLTGIGGTKFGEAVSISGDTLVVGAHGDNSNKGSVSVFTKSGSAWNLQQKILAGDGQTTDYFGLSVAMSGDTIVVGAMGDDDQGSNAGSAYVFVRTGSTWSQQQKLFASDAQPSDEFGSSVSIDGDTIVVGARKDGDKGHEAGSAFVFVRSGTTWSQQAKLLASDGSATNRFGSSVSISGDGIVVGATEAHSAYVFVRSGSTWNQQQKFSGQAGTFFGIGVSISGDTIVVGVYNANDQGTTSGSAYVYVRSGSTWNQQQILLPSGGEEGDSFGWSVSISNDTIVGGSYGDDDQGSNSGAAYVFQRTGSTWTQKQKLLPTPGIANSYFGRAVSATTHSIVIGTLGSNNAYVFGLPSTPTSNPTAIPSTIPTTNPTASPTKNPTNTPTMTPVTSSPVVAADGELTASGSSSMGVSVKISSAILAIGAHDPSGAADGGAVYIWSPENNTYSNKGAIYPFDREQNLTSQFGSSIDLSKNGDTLVVGAWGTDAVYVYELEGVTKLQGTTGTRFGVSVAISGDTIAIGADKDTNSTGVVSMYMKNETAMTWHVQQKITPFDGESGDRFGRFISLDGNVLVVGLFADNTSSGARSGSVYVYERIWNEWTISAKLIPKSLAANDFFGWPVLVRGKYLFVGAHGHGNNSGAVFVFVRGKFGWIEQAKIAPKENVFQFGKCQEFGVDDSVSRLIVGASAATPNSVFVFERNGSEWSESMHLAQHSGGQFGSSSAVQENAIFVGAPGDNKVFMYLDGASC